MAAVTSPIFHAAATPPSPFMLRSASCSGSFISGGGKRPAPLNLTYSISKVPSRDGTPLVSPAILTPSLSAVDRGASSPVWKPNSPRTPRTPRTPIQQQQRQQQSGSLTRFLPGKLPGGSPSRERPARSASFLTRRFSMPSESEQDHFRQLCQARFYEQDRDATLQIDALLREASATAQSCYNKILFSVRQKYHEDVTRERQENLRRILLEAIPDLDLDRDERKARVKNFLESYASKDLIGTHPFLKALYTVLYLQTLKDSKGGAGGKCIEWALQEEVFMEAGSGDWTKESVTLLKIILAMTDVKQQEQDERSAFYTRRNSSSESTLSRDDGPGPRGETLSEGTIRTLRMSPSLGNPELLDLLAVFPAWISQGRPREYRFPSASRAESLLNLPSLNDMEEGIVGKALDKLQPGQAIRISHGTIRISPEDRELGFEGTLVERVAGWFKRLFGNV